MRDLEWYEWVALLLAVPVAVYVFVPWDLVGRYWWGILVFLALPAFMWLATRARY